MSLTAGKLQVSTDWLAIGGEEDRLEGCEREVKL